MTGANTFELWLNNVDAVLTRAIGLTHEDLPDWGYADAWEEGLTPRQAANAALRAAGDF